MGMDPQKASRIREFLQRQPIEQWLAGEVLLCLPTPHRLHPVLKKTILLRRLSSDLGYGLLSDDTLQSLELLHELDSCSPGAAAPGPSSAALSSAYCAVAAELTVAPLRRARRLRAAAAADAGFFKAMYRAWKCRVAELEQSEARGIVGEGMREWKRAMKEAVRSVPAREHLLQRDTRWEAAEALREYLRAAVQEMGLPLLELVARAACGGEDAGGAAAATDRSGEERLSNAERGASTAAPVEELAPVGQPASVIGAEGSALVPETGTNRTDELGGQTEGAVFGGTSQQLTVPLSAEVNKVKRALKSSLEELKRVVVDPLPNALERAADVQTRMSGRSANPSDACVNQNQTGASELGPSAQSDVQATVAERSVYEDRHGIPNRGMQRPDLMDTTEQTDEGGGDSNECPSGLSADSLRRTRSSTGKRRVSPSYLQEVSKFIGRRKIKRWTPQEEDALRGAVKKHGKGNWKCILQTYPEMFGDRTEIDLKDKWRNMTR